MESANQREVSRLAFVRARDGLDGAITFAKQGLKVYRAALSERNRNGKRTGYGQAYRRELVESCSVYRRFLHGTNYLQI